MEMQELGMDVDAGNNANIPLNTVSSNLSEGTHFK